MPYWFKEKEKLSKTPAPAYRYLSAGTPLKWQLAIYRGEQMELSNDNRGEWNPLDDDGDLEIPPDNLVHLAGISGGSLIPLDSVRMSAIMGYELELSDRDMAYIEEYDPKANVDYARGHKKHLSDELLVFIARRHILDCETESISLDTHRHIHALALASDVKFARAYIPLLYDDDGLVVARAVDHLAAMKEDLYKDASLLKDVQIGFADACSNSNPLARIAGLRGCRNLQQKQQADSIESNRDLLMTALGDAEEPVRSFAVASMIDGRYLNPYAFSRLLKSNLHGAGDEIAATALDYLTRNMRDDSEWNSLKRLDQEDYALRLLTRLDPAGVHIEEYAEAMASEDCVVRARSAECLLQIPHAGGPLSGLLRILLKDSPIPALSAAKTLIVTSQENADLLSGLMKSSLDVHQYTGYYHGSFALAALLASGTEDPSLKTMALGGIHRVFEDRYCRHFKGISMHILLRCDDLEHALETMSADLTEVHNKFSREELIAAILEREAPENASFANILICEGKDVSAQLRSSARRCFVNSINARIEVSRAATKDISIYDFHRKKAAEELFTILSIAHARGNGLMYSRLEDQASITELAKSLSALLSRNESETEGEPGDADSNFCFMEWGYLNGCLYLLGEMYPKLVPGKERSKARFLSLDPPSVEYIWDSLDATNDIHRAGYVWLYDLVARLQQQALPAQKSADISPVRIADFERRIREQVERKG